MSAPLTPDEFVAALRAEGCTVVEYPGWRTNNRNHKGPWGPVNGVMNHHTAGGSSGAVQYIFEGSAELPGPLAQGCITKDGVVHLVGNGRANHAGGGDPSVLQAVIDERYGDRPPVPHQHQGSAGAVDGNAHFYGFECVNMGDGKDPWPAVQVDAMVRANAAVCRHRDWSEKSCIAHREWSDYKPDPAGPGMPSMPDVRAKIAERLAHPADWNPSVPAPTNPQGPSMTAPNRTTLARTENLVLIENLPQTIYWTTEYQDDAQGHGAGGKTVATNVRYSAVVHLTLSGLGDGEVIEVYPVEEDANGNQTGAGTPTQVRGRREGFHPVREAVTVIGTVGQRLGFQVVSRTTNTVTIEEAWLFMQSWPNA